MTEDLKLLTYAGMVFVVGLIFSFAYWVEGNISRTIGEEKIKVWIEGIAHTIVGAFIGVLVFITLNEFKHEWSLIFDSVVAVFGAIMVDTVIQFFKIKVKEME